MITQKFLFFNSFATFNSKLEAGEVNDKSIVFIKDIDAIWTHGKYFYSFSSNITSELENYAKQSDFESLQSAVDSISVPTKVSELENDSKFQTEAQVNARIESLLDGAPEAFDTLKEIAAVLNEDEGATASILTTIASKANSADVYTKYESESTFATKTELTDAISAIEIPSMEGLLTEESADAKYQPVGNYALTGDIAAVEAKIPTKVSQLTNDEGYLTEHQDISKLATKDEVASAFDWYEA